eukprot:596767-Heterocapsa_arctica.AAC.1
MDELGDLTIQMLSLPTAEGAMLLQRIKGTAEGWRPSTAGSVSPRRTPETGRRTTSARLDAICPGGLPVGSLEVTGKEWSTPLECAIPSVRNAIDGRHGPHVQGSALAEWGPGPAG